jgi:enoyl-CoA hydratase
MNAMLDEIENNEDIRVLIITGEGKAFVAGADISEMSEMNEEQGKQFSITGQSTFNRIENLKIPVIAAVNGFALGGGCELAMACDIRIANNYAKFGQPEVNLGLIPGYAGTQRLSRHIGLSNALYLLMTADMINSEEALKLGLVQKVVDAEILLTESKAIAIKIASKGPVAIKKVKEVTRKGMQTDFNSACELEAIEFGKLFGNGESGEGMKAFLEKRKPVW